MAATVNGRQNGLYTYDSFSGSKKQDEGHFLWWCAGAHQPLLKTCPSEHTKYAGLGGVILATFVLAALSSGYAIFSVFNNWAWALGFAVIWGLIIFNFDRFLVSTMRKYGVSLRKQLWMAFPRVLLALLIGITIARPLELKIFEKEVDVKIIENRHAKILMNDSLLEVENRNTQFAAEQERVRLTTRKSSLEDTLGRLQQAYVREADGTGGSFQRGIEKLTLLKQQAYNDAQLRLVPEIHQLDQQIIYQDSILKNIRAATAIKRKQYEAGLSASVGFLERNKALSDLSASESSVFWATLFISLLIILIEIGPVLSKLIMSVGPYDLGLAKIELMQMAADEDDMRRDKELRSDKLKGWYARKKENSEALINKLDALRKKSIDEELERWERGEKSPAEKQPLEDLRAHLKKQYDYSGEEV